ncbi:replication initiation protein RepM [Psychrobacter nivimaris]|uniref:replication initiation protein RepM n=1 Tax=Psychrobacter nivimaris TaxID=281738 RepID=UPI00191ADE14|nr:replication initiation protein RepM [Psychrobacter nivimaris]
MNCNSLVVKENSLIQATYNLTLVEQRLLLLAIVVIREHTHKNELDYIAFDKPIKVFAEDYIKQFDISSRSTAYEGLKDACKALFARQFSYQEKRGNGVANITSRWVSDVAYIDNQAVVELTFSRVVIPLITELEKNLTSYEIKQVSQLTSGYALRLYEVLVAWKSQPKTPKMELNEFKSKLGLSPYQYPRMDNFKRIVVSPAIEQINKHTDITVELKQYKEGRKVAGFWFSIKQKKKEKVTPKNRDPNTIDWINNQTDTEASNPYNSKQIARAVNSKKFISDYAHLVMPQNPANSSSSAWITHMATWLKKDPSKFTKRPMKEYLDDEQADRF